MIVCDLCGKPINLMTIPAKRKIVLHTQPSRISGGKVELDVCRDCYDEAEDTIWRAEAEFYQRKIKERGTNDES